MHCGRKNAEAVFSMLARIVALERIGPDVAEIAGEIIFEREISLQAPAVEEEVWIDAVGYDGIYLVCEIPKFCVAEFGRRGGSSSPVPCEIVDKQSGLQV